MNENFIQLLHKDPQEWTAKDVDAICEKFQQACDNVEFMSNKLLTVRLWRYWFLVHGEKPLMENPKYNMALMLAAQAFGEFVPSNNNDDFFSQYRRKYGQFEEELRTPKLFWGPKASLNCHSSPLIDSAILHAYIFRANKQIHEIILVGQTIPEVQQVIFQTALSTALRSQAGDLDMLNTGFYRILAPDSENQLYELPGITTLGMESLLNPSYTSYALNEFVQKLRLLQTQTELIVIHEYDVMQKREFDAELRQCVIRTNKGDDVIIIAKDTEKSPNISNLLTLMPYYKIAPRPIPLKLILDPAILELASFKELLKAFTHDTIERICADADVRQKMYKEHTKQLSEELKRWNCATPSLRKKLWDEYVILTERFNPETGITIRLAQPVKRSRIDYMENSVPSLIRDYKKWAQRMQKIISDIRETTLRSDAPIKRLAVSRFLDAALRGYDPSLNNDSIRRYFKQWSDQVTPFLNYQWRNLLEAESINKNYIIKQNTVFHTRFQINQNNHIIALVMQPFAIISPAHALITFDKKNNYPVPSDPSDYAELIKIDDDFDSHILWNDLKKIGTKSKDINKFESILLSYLSKAPIELLSEILNYLITTKEKQINNAWNKKHLLSNKPRLLEDIQTATFPLKIIILLNLGALHSARELINQIKIPENYKAQVFLWKVIIECYAQNISLIELIPLVENPNLYTMNMTSKNIINLINQARTLNNQLVQTWIDLLNNSDNPQQAINYLRRDWIKLDEYLNTPEKQIIYKAHSIIELLFLARKLESEAIAINPDGETTASVLAKIGQSLEDMFLSDSPGIPISDFFSLLEILIGEEKKEF